MSVEHMLKELALGWLVNLSNVGEEWNLLLTNRKTATTHEYVSADLCRLVSHAWAGAPDGRV